MSKFRVKVRFEEEESVNDMLAAFLVEQQSVREIKVRGKEVLIDINVEDEKFPQFMLCALMKGIILEMDYEVPEEELKLLRQRNSETNNQETEIKLDLLQGQKDEDSLVEKSDVIKIFNKLNDEFLQNEETESQNISDSNIEELVTAKEDSKDATVDSSKEVEQELAVEDSKEDRQKFVAENETTIRKNEMEKFLKEDSDLYEKNGKLNCGYFLEKLYENSATFEDFIANLVEVLKMKNRTQFFKQVIFAAMNVDYIRLKAIEDKLKEMKVSYSSSDFTWCNTNVAKMINRETLLRLLIKISEYKARYMVEEKSAILKEPEQFDEQQAVEVIITEEQVETDSKQDAILPVTNTEIEEQPETDSKQDDEKPAKIIEQEEQALEVAQEEPKPTKITVEEPEMKEARLIEEIHNTLEYMSKVEQFEKIVVKVDKTQPVTKRVEYVLKEMQVQKQTPTVKASIAKITNAAMLMKDINYDVIFEQLEIPKSERSTYQMTMSNFVATFIKKHRKDVTVKSVNFLKDLQKVIVNEDEIIN